MKLSKLAQTYDRIQQAAGEPGKIRLLSRLFRSVDKKTLEAAAHFTASEVVDPQLSARLKLIEHVFTNTTPKGAKYFTRMALNQMRIGVGMGTQTRMHSRPSAKSARGFRKRYCRN